MTLQYDYSITKFNKDGVRVISDVLEEGETLTSGVTYAQELAARTKKPESSPFVNMKEDISDRVPTSGLTLDPTLTNTIRIGDEILAPEEPVDGVGKYILTESEDGNSSIVLDNPDFRPGEASDASLDGAQENTNINNGEKEYLDPPKESDSKQEWYDYAVKKGFDGDYDEVTKNQLVADFGN